MAQSISMFRHEGGSAYNFNIQFPINTKLLEHVEGVALNMSMHQYCVMSIVPPTGHRKSYKHHPIHMKAVSQFRVCTLRRVHLKCNYITMPREGCPNSKSLPNAPHKCALLLPVFWLLPFVASHMPRFIACPKSRKKEITSSGVDLTFKCKYWVYTRFLLIWTPNTRYVKLQGTLKPQHFC